MLTEVAANLIREYKNSLNSYDEILDPKGDIKPHWKTLFRNLEQLGINDLKLRNNEIIGKLRENGVTYNVYETPDGLNRPWQLDPIPFLIDQAEWLNISKGLEQRAILLDLIIKDLYGKRNLVKDAIIPAELVFGNSGFLRPCADIHKMESNLLSLYAADLARGPDGRMWIVDNRTQAPSGSGYALENRFAMSKHLPELADGMHINKLSPFFHSLQQNIIAATESVTDSPHVIYLTPGPNNESYFEHAYLASYLGYTLAQGDDLMVRNGYVFLKSIDGLQKVDVIIRRIDDEWCDPLELRENSRLGIPGLLEALRMGNVKVLNPPGVSVVENHAFSAFMPSICKYFLQQDLLIPSVATWWCGHDDVLDKVQRDLHRLIIKKANRKSKYSTIYGKLLTVAQRKSLCAEIAERPYEYIAQEEVRLSTTPSYVDGKLVPRYAVLRSFLVHDSKTGYVTMNGGLTRSSPFEDRFVISNQNGGLSKDTWIVSNQSETLTEKITVPFKSIVNKHVSLPSRSAENLFWVGRYCERGISTIKFINIVISVLNLDRNFAGSSKQEHIKILLESLTNLTDSLPGFIHDPDLFGRPMDEIMDLVNSNSRSGSIASVASNFLNAVSSVRNQWDIEIWRTIDMVENALKNLTAQKGKIELQNNVDNLYKGLFAFLGVVTETMPRNKSFLMLDTGKLIERILAKIHVIQWCFSKVHEENTESELVEAILLNHHMLVNYRQIYKSRLDVNSMLDMIMFENTLPYSLVSMLDKLFKNVSKLPKVSNSERINETEKLCLEATTLIKLSSPEGLAEGNLFGERTALINLLYKVTALILSVSTQLTNQYFSHSVMQNSFLQNSEDDEI